MNLVWFKDIQNDAQARADLEATLRNSRVALSRLLEILEAQETQLNRQETSNDYSSPSWAYHQADRNGYRRHVREMIELLSFIKG